MPTELMWIFAALMAGMGLGACYFGGLWLTVKRLPRSPRPVLLTFGSFYGRATAVLTGFYLVMDGRWERLAVSMLGFVLIRTLYVRLLRPRQRSHSVT